MIIQTQRRKKKRSKIQRLKRRKLCLIKYANLLLLLPNLYSSVIVFDPQDNNKKNTRAVPLRLQIPESSVGILANWLLQQTICNFFFIDFPCDSRARARIAAPSLKDVIIRREAGSVYIWRVVGSGGGQRLERVQLSTENSFCQSFLVFFCNNFLRHPPYRPNDTSLALFF